MLGTSLAALLCVAATVPASAQPAANNIGGTVTGAKGPEAGVWVIAETKDLPTKYVKIVVTDDQGRYLIPDLPKGTYDIWVRGYGLVDSRARRSARARGARVSAASRAQESLA